MDSDVESDEDTDEKDTSGKRNKGGNKTENAKRNEKNLRITKVEESEMDDFEENHFLSESSVDSIDGDSHKQTKEIKVAFKKLEGGKVKPSESKTGKGPKRKMVIDKHNLFQVDQTLAGTFSDVSDVFGKVLLIKDLKQN